MDKLRNGEPHNLDLVPQPFSRRPAKWVILLILVLLAGVVSSCASEPDAAAVTPSAPVVPTATVAASAAVDTSGEAAVPQDIMGAATAVAARTPVPTKMPGPVQEQIAEVTADLGVSSKSFLGLSVVDWIDLLLSAVVVLVGYFLVVQLLTAVLRWITRRTSNDLDNILLDKIGPDIKWLVFLWFVRYAVLRLDFLSDSLRKALEDIFFAAGLLLVTVIGVRLIKYGAQWYREELENDDERNRLSPIVSAVRRVLTVVWLIIMLSIGLSHFGINLGVLMISAFVLAVVASLGLKDTITDAISGFVILVDQPFRVNDGIQITEFNTWGDVMQIGTRTTRILTRDNREVIVPNARILNSQIINYTYPDPEFRMQVDLRIAYDSDMEKARQVISDALRQVDRVLPDKDVQVLFIGFSDTARKIRVRWWVADYHLQYPMLDEVCTAIDSALTQSGIKIPITTYDLNLKMRNGESTSHDQLENTDPGNLNLPASQ